MAKEIDFVRLKLQDALDLGVLIEEEAEERYLEFAEQMETYYGPEAAQFFRLMASYEARHGQALRARRQDRFGEAPSSMDRGMLFEVEAPAYQEARAFMSARRALEVALASEGKARDFFQSALEHVIDPEVRTLFEELRREEIDHEELVRGQLILQPPDDGRDPDDFADEPPAL